MILWIKTHLLTLPLMYLLSIPRTILTRILNEAIANAKGIGLVIESMTTRMSDGDRARDLNDLAATKALWGLQ